MMIRYATDAARQALTPVDNRFILEYLPHASGTAVQVYLYGLLQCAYPGGASSLPEALGLSQPAVLEAFAYWQQQGLVRILSEKPLTVEYLNIAPGDAPAVVPGRYASLISALNALTAPRQFDMRELKHVYDWVEVYRLEEPAVLELVAHCMDVKGRRVSVNYMSTVAQSWAERGIATRADAIAYVTGFQLNKHGAAAILREWNKQRKPTNAEMALYEKWTGEWGFDEEAILAALPRLSVAGTPNFVYLDELLDRLREEKRTTTEEIRAGDAENAEERAFAKLLFDRAGKAEPATKTQLAQIRIYSATYAMPRELLLLGAEQCRGANEPFGLMKKIWNDWHEAGVDTLEKAEAYLSERSGPKPSRPHRGGKGAAYGQHNLSDEELNKLLINLDEEI